MKHRLPILLQSEAAECGLACLAMIASFHGHRLDLNEIRHRFRVSLKGTTLKDLLSFAGALGLSGRALRLEPAGLDRLQCPAILHFDMNHFVVIKEVRGGTCTIHDPALGIRRLGAEQIDRRFSGIALELAPTEDFVPKAGRPALGLRQLVGRIPGQNSVLAKALSLSVAFQLLVLAVPFYVQLVIDRAISQGDADPLAALALGFSAMILLRAAVGWLRARTFLALGATLSARLPRRIVQRMLRLPQGWFESRHVAALLSRLNSTQPVRDLLTDGLIGVVVDGMMAVATIAIAILFAPKLAAIVLSGFLCAALLKWWHVRVALERENEYVEAFAKAQQEFIETVRGISAVKLFCSEPDREARWTNRNIDSVNARHALESLRSAADLGRAAIHGLTLALVVLLGAGEVLSGGATIGVLVAFVTYTQMFGEASSKLLDFAGRFRLLDVHLQRLADVVLSAPEADGPAAPNLPPRFLTGAIGAEDVTFAYGDLEEPVFRGVSLQVNPGEFVAITGPSGGGKTTLLKVLVGLLEPRSGRILYDDRPLPAIGLGAVRRQIGVVMQNDVLMSGSIAQNISFFSHDPDPGWIAEVARMAAIDEEIGRLPMGYNTLVGDMGTVLSGGQRQRILLARALYRRPRILFIDEGTSHLDIARERSVNANLRALSITRIAIAHRSDTIATADRVLDLSEHRLSEKTS